MLAGWFVEIGDKKQYLGFSIVAIIIFSVMFFFRESSDKTKFEPTDSFLSNGVEMVGIEEKLGLFLGKGLIENEKSKQKWYFWGIEIFLEQKILT
ncbi:hypothetical protein [Evansella halocellulosilytica]|uniref:hypothetical protein n=1 Tax=Evansella halocellulosilytica TaxID=2011013 RepID=UPI000BB84870|nr:hypothetical protein [Evansella halocellulosilytica]